MNVAAARKFRLAGDLDSTTAVGIAVSPYPLAYARGSVGAPDCYRAAATVRKRVRVTDSAAFCAFAALWDMLQLVQERMPGEARDSTSEHYSLRDSDGPRFHYSVSAFDRSAPVEIVFP